MSVRRMEGRWLVPRIVVVAIVMAKGRGGMRLNFGGCILGRGLLLKNLKQVDCYLG
ncbi:hypothetical protein ES288_A09G157200v1 [Gossypium darwinii]|uniref:Uncharacterized protein n=2 Tax=Gossypium TaxID=3633 RepID=A0A5D2P451_GOSTO|nr:hypothetical protein ES288_A09G157200v1 [Gossypium darwinii]TYI10603.1 hypothetical protein ES332_A09G152800v1 [Gossypium tomentosum]